MLRIAPFAWVAVNTSVALLPTLKPPAFFDSEFGPVSALYVLPPHWITARPPGAALLRMMPGTVSGKIGTGGPVPDLLAHRRRGAARRCRAHAEQRPRGAQRRRCRYVHRDQDTHARQRAGRRRGQHVTRGHRKRHRGHQRLHREIFRDCRIHNSVSPFMLITPANRSPGARPWSLPPSILRMPPGSKKGRPEAPFPIPLRGSCNAGQQTNPIGQWLIGVPVIAFEYVLKKPRSNLMSKPNESGETRLIT